MSLRNDYIFYSRENNSIVAAGSSEECMKQLGVPTTKAFHMLVYRAKRGMTTKYRIECSNRSTAVPCIYNNYVDCSNPDQCASCGWNPTVAEARLKTFLEEANKHDHSRSKNHHSSG